MFTNMEYIDIGLERTRYISATEEFRNVAEMAIIQEYTRYNIQEYNTLVLLYTRMKML